MFFFFLIYNNAFILKRSFYEGQNLGNGAISGDDGNRYYYDENELKNAKPNQKLEGATVDFEIKDGKAISVFIVKSAGFSFNLSFDKNWSDVKLPSWDNRWIFLNLNEARDNIFNANIHSIKFFALLATFISFLVHLVYSPTFSGDGFVFFTFLSIVLMFWAFYCICKLNASFALLKYNAFALLGLVLFYFIVKSIIEDILILAFANETPWFRGILATLCLLFSLFYFVWGIRYLSKITGEFLFMLSFILIVVSMIFNVAELYHIYNSGTFFKNGAFSHSAFYYIALVLDIVGIALYVIAWLRFRNLKSANV